MDNCAKLCNFVRFFIYSPQLKFKMTKFRIELHDYRSTHKLYYLDNLIAEIKPWRGAMLNSLRLKPQDFEDEPSVEVLAGYSSISDFETLPGSRNIKLSPFPNRIDRGRYEFAGQTYQFDCNKKNEDNAIHGFLTKAAFTLVDALVNEEEDSIVLQYKYKYTGENEAYPFPYQVEIVHCFTQSFYSCRTNITNIGEQTMPLGDGWHPYFKLGTTTIDELLLQIPSNTALETDERMIPTLKTFAFNKFQTPEAIGNTQFDTGFVLRPDLKVSKVYLINKTSKLQLVYGQDNENDRGYKYLQIYTPPDRQSIALEPMSCAANAFNNKMGLIELEPTEQWSSWYHVLLNKMEE